MARSRRILLNRMALEDLLKLPAKTQPQAVRELRDVEAALKNISYPLRLHFKGSEASTVDGTT